MSARWQTPLLLSALCVVIAGGPSATVARAQCSHGGGRNPGVSQGLIAQQLLQRQQLMQQQLLLQQVQRQQLLQTAKLERRMRELAKEGPEAIRTALKDPKAEMRWIAALAAVKHGPALTDDLIERLNDENAFVRQAARRSLVSLSTQRDGKPAKGRSVDFGPAVNANRAAQNIAARKWRTWFERQQKSKSDLKTVAAKQADSAGSAP